MQAFDPWILLTITEVSDGYVLVEEAARIKDLGTIKVVAKHKIMGRRILRRVNLSDHNTIGFVSEKAIKGQTLSHGVGYVTPGVLMLSTILTFNRFSEPVTAEANPVFDTTPVVGQPDPFATYEFRYRSLG